MAKRDHTEEDGRKRWKEFLERLDALDEDVQQLNENVVSMLELGHVLVVALEHAAQRPNDSLLGIIENVRKAWQDLRRQGG